jgi:hypothetical protein
VSTEARERFCAVTDIRRATWYRWRERARGGYPANPWPRPARARVEVVVVAHALRYPTGQPEPCLWPHY